MTKHPAHLIVRRVFYVWMINVQPSRQKDEISPIIVLSLLIFEMINFLFFNPHPKEGNNDRGERSETK